MPMHFIGRRCFVFPHLIFCIFIISIVSVFSQSVDTFNPDVSGFYGSGNVTSIALQPDGEILFAGNFGTVAGLNRSQIARVHPDGSLDPSFNPEATLSVFALAVQSDGKIIVGGGFTGMGGQSHTSLARLNPDGSVDTSFNTSANSAVLAIAIQPDGRILVGGEFTNLAGQACSRMGRLNNDGSLDPTFNANADNWVRWIALQTNGSILVGGMFTNLNGTSVKHIVRLKRDGSLDSSFIPPATLIWGGAMCVQPDNRIVVCGSFTNINGITGSGVLRLNTDGSADSSFLPTTNRASIISLQANGKILVAGSLATSVGYVGRLNADGTPDPTFFLTTSYSVFALAMQMDGKVLVGGGFTNIAGIARFSMARLNNNDAAIDSITNTISSVMWMRGGSSPEIWRATFEISTNGISWNSIGDGSYISGGWQLTGVTIPSNASLRASGFILEGGPLTTSDSLVQSYGGAPCIITQPAGQTNLTGKTVTFNAVVGGQAPLNYLWQKNGINLTNGGKISGATSASLMVSGLVGTNIGNYSVVITNVFGSATSALAFLSVVNPATNDTFNPNLGTTYSTVFQSDNRVIISGNFYRGIGGVTYSGMGRANSDGLLDNSFLPRADPVYSCIEQIDGRVVIGGSFTFPGGYLLPYIDRLNTDGSYDSSFSATANGPVYSMLAQPDGKLVVAGSFTTLCNQAQRYLGRINADGSLDPNFNAGASNAVYCLALQTNGQIIVGGSFTNWSGSVHNRIARLNPDGSLDETFNPSVDTYFLPDNPAYCLAVERDGKILVGGDFFLAEGLVKPWLMRLNPDGTLDTTFNAVPNNQVYSLTLQSDGKIFVGGAFTLMNGIAQNYFARLNADGTLDSTFVGSASSTVYSTAIQPDGKFVVGGNFGMLYDSRSSNSRGSLGRFSNTEVGTHNLTFDGSTITWSRGNTCPELAWVIFDCSNDGINWSVLGSGTPTTGGWQLTGVSTTITNCIRGWGYVPCGQYDGSGWYAEDALVVASNMPPTILVGAKSPGFTIQATNGFGFSVAALPSQHVVVESSTNLQIWSPLFTNTVSFSPFYYFDPSQPPVNSKFYRAKLL